MGSIADIYDISLFFRRFTVKTMLPLDFSIGISMLVIFQQFFVIFHP